MPLPASFGSRLSATFVEFGHLCVGIDPHPHLLGEWGLSDSADSLMTFGKTVIEACAGRVGIIKPQVAFFERHGSKGFAVLEQLAEIAQTAKLLVIMDAKRGDIGTTMDGYYDAWLGKSAPFVADALTVSPFLGFDSLLPLLSQSHERGKGVFVLAATSNPEAAEVQQASLGSSQVAANVWRKLGKANQAVDGDRMGSFGAVIGATVDPANFGISFEEAASTPILAPGFGAQGALLSQFSRLFASAADRTIATVSRSVLAGGSINLETNVLAAKDDLKSTSRIGGLDE